MTVVIPEVSREHPVVRSAGTVEKMIRDMPVPAGGSLRAEDAVSVRTGAHGTVLLRFSGATIGLAQPAKNTRLSWREAIHHAKLDLRPEILERGDNYQGIVFLPYIEEIERSSPGAREMAAMSITYERAPEGEDQVAAAVQFILKWVARQVRRRQERIEWAKRFADD